MTECSPQQIASNKVSKECNELVNTGNRLQRELDSQTANCAHLASENQARAAALKATNSQLTAARLENGKLQRMVEASDSSLRILEEKYSSLKQKYDRLAEEHKEQQIAVQEVKRETRQMLDELKRLNIVNEELLNEKEKTDNLIQELNKESKKWKMKYDKARIELRSLRGITLLLFGFRKPTIG